MGRLDLLIVGSWLIVVLNFLQFVPVEVATSSQINDSTTHVNNHANTTVLGSNFLPIHDFERLIDVYGWDTIDWSFECPTIYGSIEYDHALIGP